MSIVPPGFDPPPPPPRKRCRRYNIPGHAHYLTFSCFKRQPFLTRDRSRQWMVEAIAEARLACKFDLWAWVLMPEHAHLVIFPREEQYDISQILACLKQPVSRRAAAFVREQAPQFMERMLDRQPSGRETLRFWQRGGGYDHNLWTPKHIWEKINYLHANPVRRGLVERSVDWLWSSAADYAGVRQGLLPIDWDSVPKIV